MERLIQLLDYFEDLFYAFALVQERIRRVIQFTMFVILTIALQASAIALALVSPPLAIGVAALMAVGTLYRCVVSYAPRRPHSAEA